MYARTRIRKSATPAIPAPIRALVLRPEDLDVTCADCVGTGTGIKVTEVVRTGTAVDVRCPLIEKKEYEDVVKMLVLGDRVSDTGSDTCTSFPKLDVAVNGVLVKGVWPIGWDVGAGSVNWFAGGGSP